MEKIDPAIYKHRLHKVWIEMKTRCYNKNRRYYHLYGGRGIKVCPGWSDSRMGYPNFYKWAIENGYKYEPFPNNKRNKWSLDRIDNNKDYSPDNCRWADIETQNNNRRAEKTIEYKGEVMAIKTVLKQHNTTVQTFYYLLKQGLNEVEALDYISSL